MEIIWTKPAKKDLRKIFHYYKSKVNVILAGKITDSILSSIEILKTHNIGTVEPFLEHMKQDHRYIINGHNKIIYLVVNDNIYITHIFDTRQNPIKLNQN